MRSWIHSQGWGVVVNGEHFVRPDELPQFVAKLLEKAELSQEYASASFAETPYTFCICCCQNKLFAFDGHSRGTMGALYDQVPMTEVVAHLESFSHAITLVSYCTLLLSSILLHRQHLLA